MERLLNKTLKNVTERNKTSTFVWELSKHWNELLTNLAINVSIFAITLVNI